MRTITEKHCMVTVRRTDGSIEVMKHPILQSMTEQQRIEINVAMAQAGRGEIISFENLCQTVVAPVAEYAVCCEQCKRPVDPETAYARVERMGSRKVMAYYCDACKMLYTTRR